jgi:mono/diheme cytochrome c family protein
MLSGRRLLATVFVLVLGGVAFAWQSPRRGVGGETLLGPPAEPRASSRVPVRVGRASGLYQKVCARCHGADGSGRELRAEAPAIPDFHKRRWQQGRGDGALVASILDGKGSRMPAFAGRLDEQEARELVAFIRTFAPDPPVAESGPASDFESRFRELEAQWDELQRQVEELIRSRDTPTSAARPAKQRRADR